MKRMLISAIGCLLSASVLLLSSVPASALSEEALRTKYDETAVHLQELEPQVGSMGGEWMVLGLARGGLLSDEAKDAYLKAAEAYVSSVGSDKLHARRSTENSRVILALSSVGKSAEDVAGYDLLAPLTDKSYVSRQGINGVIWALLALDCCDYPVSGDTREQLIDMILDKQCADGGWTLDGDVSDPDMTGMAIQALAPYRFYDADIRAAIDRGLERLSVQRQSGDWSPESCAQVIVALSTLGIDAQDARFCKEKDTLLDSLAAFSVPNGFEHTEGMGYHQMSTEQAFYAMTAYLRLQSGKTPLYDMRDIACYLVPDVDGDGRTTINDATRMQRFLAEFDEHLTTPQQKSADCDRDGRLSIHDVTALQRILAR